MVIVQRVTSLSFALHDGMYMYIHLYLCANVYLCMYNNCNMYVCMYLHVCIIL